MLDLFELKGLSWQGLITIPLQSSCSASRVHLGVVEFTRECCQTSGSGGDVTGKALAVLMLASDHGGIMAL